MSYYKIEIGKFNKSFGPKCYNVIFVSDRYRHRFNGMEFMASDETVVATFQKDNTNDICVCVTKPYMTEEDKEKIKNAIFDYFTYTKSYTKKVKHESSKWVKPTYKTITRHHDPECYEMGWDEKETVIDKPGHYENDDWVENVTKYKKITPEFKITFKNYY